MVLYVAEDAKTLIRTIVSFTVTRGDNGTTVAAWSCGIQLQPQGVSIVAFNTTAETLNQVRPKELIWETGGGSNTEIAAGIHQIDRIFADIKGMRKMVEGDEITLRGISDVANAFNVIGKVTLFFKE